MKLEELISKPPSWLRGDVPLADKVIFSRVRIVRNLMDFPFPNQSTPENLKAVLMRLEVASRYVTPLHPYITVNFEDAPSEVRSILLERGVPISSSLLKETPLYGRAAFIREDERMVVMVNNEDHITIQATMPGLALKDALNLALSAVEIYEKLIEMAFIDTMGFLSSSPINTGLGISIGVMLHLPGIALSRQIKSFFELFQRSKFIIRNYFMTTTAGSFYYMHSFVKLGLTEDELYRQFAEVVDTVLDLEDESRDTLGEKYRDVVEDKVARALAILNTAKLISFSELVEVISYVRLGIQMGLVKGFDYTSLNETLFLAQPAHMKRFVDQPGLPDEELELQVNRLRAAFVRSHLKIGKFFRPSGGTSPTV